MRKVFVYGLATVLSAGALTNAYAADKTGDAKAAAPAATAQTAAPAAATTDPDYAQRLELAKKMHEIRPARQQVQDAVNQISANLSPMDKDKFIKMVDKAFDYDKLEKTSIDTMVQLFTVAELQKMVDYFGSPEARSIEKKLPQYQAKMQPEIIRMLDAAMIAQKTGGEAPPPNAPNQMPAQQEGGGGADSISTQAAPAGK